MLHDFFAVSTRLLQLITGLPVHFSSTWPHLRSWNKNGDHSKIWGITFLAETNIYYDKLENSPSFELKNIWLLRLEFLHSSDCSLPPPQTVYVICWRTRTPTSWSEVTRTWHTRLPWSCRRGPSPTLWPSYSPTKVALTIAFFVWAHFFPLSFQAHPFLSRSPVHLDSMIMISFYIRAYYFIFFPRSLLNFLSCRLESVLPLNCLNCYEWCVRYCLSLEQWYKNSAPCLRSIHP